MDSEAINPTPTDAATTQVAFRFVQKMAVDLDASDDLKLPGFPEVVAKLQKALSDEHGSLKQVAVIINSEPALAARMLQLANSAAFRQSAEPVGELRTAVAMLGFNVVRATATNFAMAQLQEQDWLRPLHPELQKMWRQAILVAATSYVVAKHLEAMPADKAMVAGLFHQLGMLYLLTVAYRDDKALLDDPAWPHIQAEWHPTVTRAILESWGLPEDVTYATESQDAVLDGQTENLDRLSLVVAAAKFFVYEPAAADAADSPLNDVKFSGQSFADLVEQNRSEIKQVLATLS
ncbi:MAG: HDOD domain-containing protein [Gammaproteobacteria bacterium]|jgi:HD-like signal output (HDOD) protein|nr:HDOD domain-containing protein [Gammaproteobacteria bacterium]